MWSNKYIGIPFKAKGRDYDGVDCWGLVRLVYQDEYSINLPSFEQDYIIQDNNRISELIAQYKEGWELVESPIAGNIVLFRMLGHPTHVGVMINETEFLHSRQGYDVAIGSINNTRWNNRVLGYYRYVEQKTNQYLKQLPVALKAENIPFIIENNNTTLETVSTKLLELTNLKRENIALLLNNTIIPELYWNKINVKDADVVSYRIIPSGGDNGMAIFKMIVITVIAIHAPYMLAEAGVMGAGYVTTAAGATVLNSTAIMLGAAATIASSYALNYIFPVRGPDRMSDPGTTEAQFMLETVSNRATPYGGIPVVLGKVRLTPPLAAQTYITYPEERTSYLTTALAWGFGPLSITDFKIGENPISEYKIANNNQDQATVTGFGDESSQVAKFNTLYSRDVYQPPFSPFTLVCDGNPEGTQGQFLGYDNEGNPNYGPTTFPPPGETFNLPSPSGTASEVSVAFHFPQGLRRIKARGDGAGDSYEATVQLKIEFSEDGGTTWDAEIFSVTRTNKDAFTITKNKTFSPEKVVLARATRLTGDNTEDNPDWRYAHEVKVIAITYYSNRKPLIEPPNSTIARSAYVIQASDQLTGQLEGINAIVQSICKPANNFINGAPVVTSNPASLFLHVLTHPANPQRIPVNEIETHVNMLQLAHWYTYCDTLRTITFHDVNSNTNPVTKSYKYEYNGILASQRSILEILRDICAAGRASPAIIDGKWTVTIDEPKTEIVQHFSPHNSWGFESVRAIPKIPDALKITFYDEEQNYQQVETIVYNWGKNYSNSTLFESIEVPGVTNRAAVIDHGKWHFAQAKLRREIYSINCDIEYLACNRGDRVKLTHDVPAWGLGSGRIQEIFTNNQTSNVVVKLTESVPIDSTGSKTYKVRVRSKTGTGTLFNVINLIPFSGFTRSGTNTIIIQVDPAIVPVLPFDSTDTLSINCNSFSQINLTTQKVTVNRETNTISYTTSATVGVSGFNPAEGFIRLTGEYEYLAINSNQSINNTNLDIGDLFLFGETNKESQDLLVLSIEPQDNKTAKLTLVDYGVTPGYEANPTGQGEYNIFTQYKVDTNNSITSDFVYNALITLPSKNAVKTFTTYIVPYITSIYSNDNAVEVLSPGVYKYNIKISYATIGSQIPTNTKYVECQYYLKSPSSDSLDNIKSILSEYTSNTITIPDVSIGQQYKIRLRYVTSDGTTGPWPISTTEAPGGWQTHTVVGFEKNTDRITNLSVTRVGRFFRINIGSPIPANFKEYKIKIYKNVPGSSGVLPMGLIQKGKGYQVYDTGLITPQGVWNLQAGTTEESYLPGTNFIAASNGLTGYDGKVLEDFWDLPDSQINKIITTSNNVIEVDIISSFNQPRIGSAQVGGVLYRIACRPINVAGNASTMPSALANIVLTTILP